MKRLLGIVGSPRRNGNTEILTGSCLKAASALRVQTKMIRLSEIEIHSCLACDRCPPDSTRLCIQRDAMNQVYDELQWAEAVVFGTPVYFGTISAQLKALMDRTRPLWIKGNRLSGKLAAGIAVGEGKFGGQELALETIRTFCLNHGMIVLGSIPPYGNWEVCGVADKPGDIRRDHWALEASQGLGRRLAGISLKCKGQFHRGSSSQ